MSPSAYHAAFVARWAEEHHLTAGQVAFARHYAATGKQRESAARANYRFPKRAGTRLARHPKVRELVRYLTTGEFPELNPPAPAVSVKVSFDPNNPQDMAELERLNRETERSERLDARRKREDRRRRSGRGIGWRRDESEILALYRRPS